MTALKKVMHILFRTPLFILLISKGDVEVVAGTISTSLLKSCKLIIAESGIESGSIYTTCNFWGGIVVKSTMDIPKETLQKVKTIITNCYNS